MVFLRKYASLLTVCVEAAVQVLLAVPELPALLLVTPLPTAVGMPSVVTTTTQRWPWSA